MSTTIYIQLKNNDEVVALSNDDLLSADLSTILFLLINEEVSLEQWLKVAIAYRSLGDDISFQNVLYTCSNLQQREILFFSSKEKQIVPSSLNKELVDKFNKISHLYREKKRSRLVVLNALISFYIIQAKKLSDRKMRDELFKHATRLINRCDSIDNQETLTWINKAIMHLYKDNIPSARVSFSNILRDNPSSRIARIGLGLCYYHDGMLKDSLREFSHVLVSLFNEKGFDESDFKSNYSNLRCAIGILWSHLNSQDKAILAYERQYEFTPQNDKLLSGLGVLLLNRYFDRLLYSNTEEESKLASEDYDRAIKYFSEAYNINPDNYIASNQLSNYLFVSSETRDYNKIKNLARKASKSTSHPKVKAESSYYLGRCYHAQGLYEDAFKHYSDSASSWTSFVLPYYGLGQMYMKRNQTSKAIESFLKVYEKFPDNIEINKVLSHLYAKTDREKALKHLEKAIKYNPHDSELWIDYAVLYERTNPNESVKGYESAIKCIGNIESVPYQLWNNLGCTRVQIKDYQLAKDSFLRAIIKNTYNSLPNASSLLLLNEVSIQKVLDEIHNTPHDKMLSESTTDIIIRSVNEFAPILDLESNVTMIYNIARVYEAMKSYDSAISLYQRIYSRYPSYTDCMIRLGCIYRDQGQKDKANETFNEILKVDSNNIDAMTYLANMYFENKEYQNAQNLFDKILKIDKKDMYSVLQLANISLKAGIKETDPAKKEKLIQRATDFFASVIKTMPNNVYAANGLGIIFIQRELNLEATDTFLFVREATDSIPDVWINLAHSYFSKNDYSSAINIYERCIKKFGFDHPSVIEGNVPVLLGQCYFHTDKFDLAKETMLKAIEVCPNKDDIWYDYATICKEYALKILKLTSNKNVSLESLKLAVEALKIAEPIYERLSESTNMKRSFSTKKCKKFYTLCKTNVELANDKLQQSEELARKLEEERERSLREEEERLRFEKEEEERRKREEEERIRKLEEEAMELQKKAESLVQNWASSSEDAEDKKKSKKRKKPSKSDMSDFITEDDEELIKASGWQDINEEEENIEEKRMSALEEIRKRRKE